MDAALQYVEGTLRAAGEGARAFQKQVRLKDVLDPQSRSGLVGALINGYATYLEGVAKVTGEVARTLRSAEESKPPDPE
jgi:hypothetical protein